MFLLRAKRNGGSDLLKVAAKVCRVSAQNPPAQPRFFSFPVGRGRFSLYIKIKKEPIITSKLTLCIIGSASVRLALGRWINLVFLL